MARDSRLVYGLPLKGLYARFLQGYFGNLPGLYIYTHVYVYIIDTHYVYMYYTFNIYIYIHFIFHSIFYVQHYI